MEAFQIGKHLVGDNQPCFLVAEIGINHNGDTKLAKKMIDAAADAGADSVKFQNYRTEDFISERSLTYEYTSQGQTVVESQYDIFKRCELDPQSLQELMEHSNSRGLIFHSTPTSKSGIEDLSEIGVPVLKNGSDYLTHLPLVRAMGETGLTTVLSTGMATLSEIDEAVRAFRETGNDQLILLHCTSSYPTPPEDVNLRQMSSLRAAFGSPIGFSDHTSGTVAAIGAVALGACWIEKHFTLDKSLPGPDHHLSADPEEFHTLVQAVRTTEKHLGDSTVVPAPSEALGKRKFRLSCVTTRDLSSGHSLTSSDIDFRRPGTGLPPSAIKWITGRQLSRDMEAGKVLSRSDFI